MFIYDFLFNTNTYILSSLFIFFDCLDGHLARTTNQVTVIDDILDHTVDFIFLSLIFSIIISLLSYAYFEQPFLIIKEKLFSRYKKS